ncbi:MAG TPA: hypothetical protein VGD73_10225 [Pseudonocardia sp.]|uniref:hypothetical protein n=1 Tax=Pseudonocardia sp. TaxID=60912 RepID=UPI002ED92F2D
MSSAVCELITWRWALDTAWFSVVQVPLVWVPLDAPVPEVRPVPLDDVRLLGQDGVGSDDALGSVEVSLERHPRIARSALSWSGADAVEVGLDEVGVDELVSELLDEPGSHPAAWRLAWSS